MDTAGSVGKFTSIVLDTINNPHISYFRDTNNDLKYARFSGANWYFESVDTTGDVGEWTSIALDSNENPHISYLDDYSVDLKYAYWNGNSWEITTLDWNGSIGRYSSIAIDTTDHPHISYLGNYSLKYIFYNIGPADFELEFPDHNDYFYFLGTLDWEDSGDGGQHDMRYDLWYSTETDFDPHQEQVGLTESEYTFRPGELTDGETYHWKVVADDGYERTWCTAPGGGGNDEYWTFHATTSGVEDEGNVPTTFALHPAVPNPNDGSASIGYALPRECEIELALYDVKGRKVATLAEGTHQPGEFSADVDSLSSGVYIYEMTADEFSDSKKMVVR